MYMRVPDVPLAVISGFPSIDRRRRTTSGKKAKNVRYLRQFENHFENILNKTERKNV